MVDVKNLSVTEDTLLLVFIGGHSITTWMMWCARRVVQHKQNMLTQRHLTLITMTLAQQ